MEYRTMFILKQSIADSAQVFIKFVELLIELLLIDHNVKLVSGYNNWSCNLGSMYRMCSHHQRQCRQDEEKPDGSVDEKKADESLDGDLHVPETA